MPAIAVALFRRQKRMSVWSEATPQRLTRRGNLRFPQIVLTDCAPQFTLHEVLKVPPISQPGTLDEIRDSCASADQLRNAENQPQSLL